MSLGKSSVGTGHACEQAARGSEKLLAGYPQGPLLRVPGQKFFGQVSTTFFKLKQFRNVPSGLACRDSADTTLKLKQPTVVRCA